MVLVKNAFFLSLLLACAATFALSGFDFNVDLPSFNPSNYGGIGGFSPDDFNLPTPYDVQLLSWKQISDASPEGITSAQLTAAPKEQAVLYFNPSTSTLSKLEVYGLSGSTISLLSSRSFQVSGKETETLAVRKVGAGLMVGAGDYVYNGSKTYPFLGTFTYASPTLSGPSLYSISPLTYGKLADLDSGDVTGDGIMDYVSAYDQRITGVFGITYHLTRIHVRSVSSQTSYQLDHDYVGGNSYGVRVGNFASTAGKEIAFIGKAGGQVDLYLLRVSGSNLTKVSEKSNLKTSTGKNISIVDATAADLDGDGYDELIIAGSYLARPGAFFPSSDMVQVYKYTASGWSRKAEYLSATADIAYNTLSGASDVDSNGKKEVITFGYGLYTLPNGNATFRNRLNIFTYDPANNRLVRLSKTDIEPYAPSSTNYYDPRGAALGDFDGDGKKDLAFAYRDVHYGNMKLAFYRIGQDLYPPNITLYSPYYSTYYANGTKFVQFNAYDNNGINMTTMRVRLTGPGGYDSGYKQGNVSYVTTKSMTMSLFLNFNLTPGNYTLRVEAKDRAGNLGNKTKTIRLIALPAAAPPAAPPEPPPAPPAEEPPAAPPAEPSPVETPPAEEPPVAIAPPATEPGDVLPDEIPPAAPNNTQIPAVVPSNTPTQPPVQPPAQPPVEQNNSIIITIPPVQPPTGNQQPPSAGAEASGQSKGEISQQTQAASAIGELEAKVAVAKTQGIDTAQPAKVLEDAKKLAQDGKYGEAVVEAQKGIAASDALLAQKQRPFNMLDWAPYILSAGILAMFAFAGLVLVGAFLLFGRKPAAPQAGQAKPEKKN